MTSVEANCRPPTLLFSNTPLDLAEREKHVASHASVLALVITNEASLEAER